MAAKKRKTKSVYRPQTAVQKSARKRSDKRRRRRSSMEAAVDSVLDLPDREDVLDLSSVPLPNRDGGNNNWHMDEASIRPGLGAIESAPAVDASDASSAAAEGPSDVDPRSQSDELKTRKEELEYMANDFRAELKRIARGISELRRFAVTYIQFPNAHEPPPFNGGEVLANLEITYRCLEDASMRLGKVIQASDGGISVYDKRTTVGA